jgi:serine/threonine protein kinase
LRFPPAGTQLLDFFLIRELGRGALSQVYLARQGGLANRHVVLKVSTCSFGEADRLAQLQHAHIVPIYSVHRAGDFAAVCMPYFGATTLADVVRELQQRPHVPISGQVIVEILGRRRRGDLQAVNAPNASQRAEPQGSMEEQDVSGAPPLHPGGPCELQILSRLSHVDAVLWIVARLADGLNHSHERGIQHCDLKPANILLADDGRPMLLDFNLSHDLKRQDRFAELHRGGTLPYMSPEQLVAFQSHQDCRDCRSDIYSLGVILYELLAGQHPFPVGTGELNELLAEAIGSRQDPPLRLRQQNSAVTPAVAVIVHTCLARDPKQRYQSAAQLKEDLERQLNQLPLKHASEPSWRERFRKFGSRNSRLIKTVVAVLTVALGALTVTEYEESRRIGGVAREIDELLKAGKQALSDDDAEVAHGRFLAAWMKIQAEPALVNRELGVSGWLDHSRRAVLRRQWDRRGSVRDYDERRDEALVLSLLLEPSPNGETASVIEAIHGARDLTLAGDPGWIRERELLTLVEAHLMEIERGPAAALDRLDATDEFSSREFHDCRAALLDRLDRSDEARQERRLADRHAANEFQGPFLRGISQAQRGHFAKALADFEQVLATQPESFVTRLFQAICFLRLGRPAEARVGLTACIAQRPFCLWSRFFRAQAFRALGDSRAALTDLQRIFDGRHSSVLERAAQAEEELLNSAQGSAARIETETSARSLRAVPNSE